MKAALYTKCKSMGPIQDPIMEMSRMLPWWPTKLRWVANELQRQVHEFKNLARPHERHAMEKAMLRDLADRIDKLKPDVGASLLSSFLKRVQEYVEESARLRKRALSGEPIDVGAEERWASELEAWLMRYRFDPRTMGEAEVLLRWLRAWTMARWRQERSVK